MNAKLNPICHLLALLGAHHIFHVSKVRVKRLIYCVHCLALSQTRGQTEENIKVDLREIDCEVSRWLELHQNRDQVWVSGLLALNIAFCCRI